MEERDLNLARRWRRVGKKKKGQINLHPNPIIKLNQISTTANWSASGRGGTGLYGCLGDVIVDSKVESQSMELFDLTTHISKTLFSNTRKDVDVRRAVWGKEQRSKRQS